MKTNNKIQMVLLCCLMFGAFKMNSQNAKWSRNGDNVANNDWLGTTNSEPLLLKANNNLGIKIKPNGEVILKPLDLGNTTFPNGLVMVDGMGKVFRINLSNNATDFLKGDGTWGTLPASASAWNVVGNNLVSTNTGNVGIGNPNPFYKLDVTGDVRISNNLLVGGGIITSQTVNATGEVRGGDGIIYNDISVGANGNFGANVNVGNNASVANNLSIGPVNTDFQLSLTPASGPNPQIFNFAKMTNLPPVPVNTCVIENFVQPAVNNFGGVITLYHLNTQMAYLTGSSILDIGTKPGSSFISSRLTPLVINKDCPQDIYLMGPKQGFGTTSPSEKFHFTGGNILLDDVNAPSFNQNRFFVKAGNNTAAWLETNQNYDYGLNTVISVNRGSTKAIDVINTDPSNSGDYFHVWGDGHTLIGKNMWDGSGAMLSVGQPVKNALAFSLVDNTNATPNDFFNVYGSGYTEIKIHNSTALPTTSVYPRVFAIKDVIANKDVFVVNASGKTYAREVEISLQSLFPDYVFAKDYNLKTISEVSDFIQKNKHLPGFEKAEYYEKNGINVNDMFVKQQEKIEELTLYIIELEKRLKALETNIKSK